MAHPSGAGGDRSRALVRNAGDPRQVKFAERMEQRRVERFARALIAVMNSLEGRIVMAQLIRRAGVYRSIWDSSSAIHYNAGRQDYGHELMADLVALDEDLYQQMEREDWAWQKQQQREIDASHTRRSDEHGDTDGR